MRHQGKLTGTLSCIIWLSAAVMHPLVGRWLDATGKDYAKAVGLAGLPPLLGVAALVLFWKPTRPPAAEPLPPFRPKEQGPPIRDSLPRPPQEGSRPAMSHRIGRVS